MKWCCIGFKANYEAAGQRGVAILIGRDSLGEPEIALQYRAVDKGQEEAIRCDRDIPVSMIVDIRLVFCPWCGCNAVKWYGNNVDLLFRPDLRVTY